MCVITSNLIAAVAAAYIYIIHFAVGEAAITQFHGKFRDESCDVKCKCPASLDGSCTSGEEESAKPTDSRNITGANGANFVLQSGSPLELTVRVCIFVPKRNKTTTAAAPSDRVISRVSLLYDN